MEGGGLLRSKESNARTTADACRQPKLGNIIVGIVEKPYFGFAGEARGRATERRHGGEGPSPTCRRGGAGAGRADCVAAVVRPTGRPGARENACPTGQLYIFV